MQILATLLLVCLVTQSVYAQRGRGRRPGRRRTAEKVFEGEMAPDFTLKSPDGQREVTLSEFRGKRPVALVFGSYT